MKKGFIRSALALALSAALLLNGCTITAEEEVLPEATLEKLEDAINAMDMQGILDLMEEDAEGVIKAQLDIVLKLTGALVGVDFSKFGLSASNIMDLLPVLSIIAPELDIDSDTVDFQAVKTVIKDDKATIYFIEAISGQSAALNMEKDDDEWLIVIDVVPVAEEEADRIIIAETAASESLSAAEQETAAEAADHAHSEEEGSAESGDGTASSVSGTSSAEGDSAADDITETSSQGKSGKYDIDFSISTLLDEDAFNEFLESLE